MRWQFIAISTVYYISIGGLSYAEQKMENSPNGQQAEGDIYNFPAKKHVPITCRHPDFGQEGWRKTQIYSDSSDMVDGGHDQNWWCNRVTASFIQSRGIGAQYAAEKVSSHEESHKDWKGHVTYKYHCTMKISWDPLYAEKKDARCGVVEE